MALVLAAGSDDPNKPKRKKQHQGVPRIQLKPSEEEWPETRDEVYDRVARQAIGTTAQERLVWANSRIANYKWNNLYTTKLNPFLLDCYVRFGKNAQRELEEEKAAR